MMNVEPRMKILVIGVGKAGENAIASMNQEELAGVECSVAAGESREEIVNRLDWTDLIFLVTGLEEKTEAASVIAEVAKELGILTIVVATFPQETEGEKSRAFVETNVENLTKVADAIVLIPANGHSGSGVNAESAGKPGDPAIQNIIQSVTDTLLKQGLINLDLADVAFVLRNVGVIRYGFGESAGGKKRAREAAEMALSYPYYQKSVNGTCKLLVNITADESLGLDEAQEALDVLCDAFACDRDENCQWGVIYDEGMEGKLRITFLAGYSNS